MPTGTSSAHINTNPFSIFYTSGTGTLIPFYRLYSDITKEHLYTTDQNEYNVLATRNWAQEGVIGQIPSGPMTIGGNMAVPYYRLYDDQILNHLWTTDRNEYFTLRRFPNSTPEGVIGYLFRTPVTLSSCPVKLRQYSFVSAGVQTPAPLSPLDHGSKRG